MNILTFGSAVDPVGRQSPSSRASSTSCKCLLGSCCSNLSVPLAAEGQCGMDLLCSWGCYDWHRNNSSEVTRTEGERETERDGGAL